MAVVSKTCRSSIIICQLIVHWLVVVQNNKIKKCARMGLEIQDTTIYSVLFADDQLLIAQDYEDLDYFPTYP
jgi:hypothetical protein